MMTRARRRPQRYRPLLGALMRLAYEREVILAALAAMWPRRR